MLKKLCSWVMGSSWKSLKVHARARDVRGDSGEVLGGNEEHVIGNWRKGQSVIKWQRTWLNYVLVFVEGGIYK